MKFLKTTFAGVALLACLGTAQASLITVGGVTWDPDAATDFSSQSVNIRQFINPVTGELTGFGIVTGMNGKNRDNFCVGCDLTFQFSGFLPTSSTLVPGFGDTVSYSGGSVKFFVNARTITDPEDYLALTFANTGGVNSWLELTNNGIFSGTNNGNLSGLGFLDATGGLALSNFDTNTQAGGTDLRYSASLTYDHVQGSILDMSGTGNLRGNTIPEPSSLALIGLSLVGLGFARRKANKA